MNWTEIREFTVLGLLGLGAAIIAVLAVLAVLVITGAAIGATAGSVVWGFKAVLGGCQ